MRVKLDVRESGDLLEAACNYVCPEPTDAGTGDTTDTGTGDTGGDTTGG